MKIIYIDKARIPTEKAYGYTISKLCEEFASLGHEVELVIPDIKNIISSDLFAYYGLKRNFKLNRIATFDFIGRRKNYGQLIYFLQLINFLWCMLFFRIGQEAIAYTRNPEVAWLMKLKGAKVVYECHSWMTKEKIFCAVAKRVDRIVVTTSFLKKLFISSGFDENKIFVAADAADQKIFDLEMSKAEARNKLNFPSDKIILGYSGNFKTMGEEKGIDMILQAIKILKDKLPKIVFIGVGGHNDDIKNYMERAGEMNIIDQVKLLPRLDLKTLAIFQKACDILLMPYPDTEHYRYYMSPLKMFEYMTARRPIIASDLPSIREVLDDNNAFFIPAATGENLAATVMEIINNTDRAQTMAEQAYIDVKKYSWTKRAASILQFIGK